MCSSDLHTSGEFVQGLETAIRRQQGTALDAYLTKLVAARQVEGFDKQLRERVHQVARDLSKEINDTAISRVAVRFALVQVGLELAHSFGLLPFPTGHCSWAVRKMFADWLDIRGGEGSIEIKEVCNKIQHLFVANQHNPDRIINAIDPGYARNLLAYKSPDSVTDGVEFWIPPAIFSGELAAGVDKSELVKELVKRGWLKPSGDKKRQTLRRSVGGNRSAFFVFTPFWLETTSEDPANDEKAVYQVYQVYQVTETSSETSSESGTPWYTAETEGVPGVPGGEIKPQTGNSLNDELEIHLGVPGCTQGEPKPEQDFDQPGTPGTPVKVLGTPECTKGEPILAEGFGQPGTLGTLGTPIKSISSKYKSDLSKQQKTPPLKFGTLCTYIGENSQLAQQYAGVLVVQVVDPANGIAALTPDGRMTTWLDPDQLKVA